MLLDWKILTSVNLFSLLILLTALVLFQVLYVFASLKLKNSFFTPLIAYWVILFSVVKHFFTHLAPLGLII